MIYSLFFGIVALLGGVYIWIGKRASKGIQSDDDYFLMGRNLSFAPLFLTLLATQLGGGTLLGAAQEAYQKGWMVLFYPMGASIGLFALGAGFGGKLREMNISTIAEIFEKIYRSRTQRYLASGLSILTLLFILVAQGIAARLFFGSMGVDSPWIFITFWTVLVAYTVMGGLKAVVNTDVLQALFIVFTLLIAFFSIDGTEGFVKSPAVLSTGSDLSEIPWCSWLFMPLLFMLIEQDMGQRCFAAKNKKAISFAGAAAGALLLLCSFVAIYFGVLASERGLEISNTSSVLVESILALTNPVVGTLFMVAIFLAIISTADSLLCSISSNLAYDFIVLRKGLSCSQVKVSQALTLATGLLALGFTFVFDNVVTLLMISYELSVCVLFVPIFAATLFKRASVNGAYGSMLFGLLGFVVFRLIPTPLPKEILAILLSVCGYCIGQKLRVGTAAKEAAR